MCKFCAAIFNNGYYEFGSFVFDFSPNRKKNKLYVWPVVMCKWEASTAAMDIEWLLYSRCYCCLFRFACKLSFTHIKKHRCTFDRNGCAYAIVWAFESISRGLLTTASFKVLPFIWFLPSGSFVLRKNILDFFQIYVSFLRHFVATNIDECENYYDYLKNTRQMANFNYVLPPESTRIYLLALYLLFACILYSCNIFSSSLHKKPIKVATKCKITHTNTAVAVAPSILRSCTIWCVHWFKLLLNSTSRSMVNDLKKTTIFFPVSRFAHVCSVHFSLHSLLFLSLFKPISILSDI